MTISILRTAADTNQPFKAGVLTFQPVEAKSALEFYEMLPTSQRPWFEKQPLMRMVLLGRAHRVGPPLIEEDRK